MQEQRQLDKLDREELLRTTHRLLAEADALSSRISVLNEIGLAVNQSLDLDRIERVIAKQAKWLMDFEHCSVCLKEGNGWIIKTLFGTPEPKTFDLEQMPNLASVMNSTRPLLLHEGSPSSFLAAYQSQLLIPLSAESEFFGTINFAATMPKRYSQDDIRLGYMLSLQLSSAIRNANLIAELRNTREELNLRVEELDAYGHTIAHDLKSPLSNILLRLQVIEMRFGNEMSAPLKEMLSSLEQSGRLMTRMIDQLLLLTKIRHSNESNVLVPIRKTVDSALLRFSHELEAKKIQLLIEDLPDAYGQTQWVEEVFANLISNAIKYMGASSNPSITISAKNQTGKIRYEVHDTGMGIKAEDLNRLFSMFSRLHLNQGIDGLGLGLSIVQRVVKKLGGELGVESEFGKGSCFWFSLPSTNPIKESKKNHG